MSIVRENSKCGDETHVSSSSNTGGGTTTTSNNLTLSQPSSVLSSNSVVESVMLGGAAGPEIEVSVRVPPPPSGGAGGGGVDLLVNFGKNDNENDSDPPVENYNLFTEFQYDDDEDEDEEEEDGNEGMDGEDEVEGGNNNKQHHFLTAQEQRQHLRRKRGAQGGHFRKRRKSTNIDGNYVPPYKKRFRRQTSVLPSKFLLGGNIRDPLNLASLADAKVNAALNAETPKSSPLPVPANNNNNNNHHRQGEVPVFIPKNPDDPLGLQTEAHNPCDFIAGIRKSTKVRKHRHRKKGGRKRTDSECSIEKSEDSDGKETKETSLSSEEEFKLRSTATGEVDQKSAKTEEVKELLPPPPALVLPPPAPVKEKVEEEVAVKEQTKKVEVEVPEEIPPVAGPSSAVSAPPPAAAPAPPGVHQGGGGRKRARPRRRSRKGLYRGQFHPSFYYFGKSSDYVPLGTPSAHEGPYYSYTPPGGGPDFYDGLPFESPSIANFVSQEHFATMEPFSPPPKPEVKRRRIEPPVPPAVPPPLQEEQQPQSSSSSAPVPPVEDEPITKEEPPPAAEEKPAAVVEIIEKPKAPAPPPVEKPKSTLPFNNFVKPAPPNKLNIPRTNARKRFRHKSDPIVSPVVPQPGCRRRFNNHHPHHFGNKKEEQGGAGNETRDQIIEKSPSGLKFRKKDAIFQFGNYNRYYGYRGTEPGEDLRLNAFPRGFFRDKEVLDVGCNIGHVTMLIARDYKAERVVGFDIDPKLIAIAKKNVKHYVDRDPGDETVRFPHSCTLMYGMLQPPPGVSGDTRKIPFPYNVSFKQENYVLESDDLLETVKPEYDIILCLSITKWIHLNYGDEGLKRFFRRAFLHLRPGGKLILEPQPWSSYKKKKKLTEQIFAAFKAIRLYPDKFQDFLLKEVGFSTMEKLATPAHSSKGFQRPLMVFTKAEATPSSGSPSHSTPLLGLVEMTTTTSVPAISPSTPNSSSSPAVVSLPESAEPKPSFVVVDVSDKNTTTGT